MIPKKRDPKPKIFFTAAVLMVLCLLGYQLLFPAPTPTSEGVIQLLQQAEAIYQPGNTQLVQSTPGQPEGYDQLSGYDEAVASLFTDEGIEQLEQSTVDGKPLILRQDGSTFRLQAGEDQTGFFDSVQAAKLLDQQGSLFAFRIEYPSPDGGDQPAQTDVVVAMQEDGSLLLYSLHYPLCDQ